MAKEGDEKYSLKLLGTGVDIQNPAFLQRLADVALIPVEEVAKLGATAVRVLALPFRAAEAYGERLVQTIKNAEAQVPPERQIEPAPSIAGPILENVKHLEDGNPLLTMYENLLARAMDRDRMHEAHPAFPKIIEQLSPDEAKLLYLIREAPILETLETRHFTKPKGAKQHTRWDSIPRAKLAFPEHDWMYIYHLEALYLLVRVNVRTSHDNSDKMDESGNIYYDSLGTHHIRLSRLGALFASACIPTKWEFPE